MKKTNTILFYTHRSKVVKSLDQSFPNALTYKQKNKKYVKH